jgi:hypothetical protein
MAFCGIICALRAGDWSHTIQNVTSIARAIVSAMDIPPALLRRFLLVPHVRNKEFFLVNMLCTSVIACIALPGKAPSAFPEW